MILNVTADNNFNFNDSASLVYENVDLATVDLFKGYPDGLLKFATAFCIILMLIGIPGNIITIIALSRYKEVRNATAIFIINLSCSDLMFCCVNLPLAASKFWHRSWVHGHILCVICSFATYTFVAVSLFTVLAITINRYVMIVHPRLYPKLYKTRNIAVMIATVWATAVGVFIPTLLKKYGQFGLDPVVALCDIIPDKNNHTPKQTIVTVLFLLPWIAIVFCYARILFIVRKTTMKSLTKNKLVSKDEDSSSGDLSTSTSVKLAANETSCSFITDKTQSNIFFNNDAQKTITFNNEVKGLTRTRSKNIFDQLQLRRIAIKKSMALLKLSLPTRKDRRLGTLIFVIMISYCVCHLPIATEEVFVKTTNNQTFVIVAQILLFVSSSINPVIYVLMSNEYRKAYRHLLKRRRKGILVVTNK